jgi:shikimate kinase
MRLPRRIALIGFMGSGKSTVGRILAERLGYALVDSDAAVEERAGAPIRRIFLERGEPAFRDLEADTLETLATRSRVVIAAGGGAPAQPRNRHFFARRATTFHLRVSLETARRRTEGDVGRPLLAQGDETVRRLYESRLPVYEELGAPVDTDGKSPAQVAEEIIRLLENPMPKRPPGKIG